MTNDKKRVLIIDDDLHMLFVWRAALTHIPHQCIVDTAQNRCEALEKMASLGSMDSKGYDLIIMDPVMTNVNGCELTNTLRTLYGDIPVVWVTSNRYANTEADAQDLHVFCCLDKPISLALLRQVVWEALESTNV